MITGFASPEATASLADKHSGLHCNLLGETGLTVSAAGFGCYRISQGVLKHEQALHRAILAGINLVDTSANYADGGSESLVGKVLADLVKSGDLKREQMIVVSKVGYLQGQNLALSRQRKEAGNPFVELVEYDKGTEHCIHPAFLKDQLGRSLERLGLETLDFYLLHNPEYYLGWSAKNSVALEEARTEYYRRIQAAFEYLEEEVSGGRIRYYGVSSNTFAVNSHDPEFTSLETVCRIAEAVSAMHHFRLVQLPFNLCEPGAVLEHNQLNSQSVLQHARAQNLGVLVNRPLNAFAENRLIRLADLTFSGRQSSDDIIRKIRAVQKSEIRFWKKMLPGLDIRDGLKTRIKQQISISDNFKHYYLNFGSYENFRQARANFFMPRVNGVMDYLKQHLANDQDVTQWMDVHGKILDEAFEAVASIYSEAAALQIKHIRQLVDETDKEWAAEGTMSQKAIRALRSTSGVSSVLVGMRRKDYVDDVIEEMRRPVVQKERLNSWETVQKGMPAVLA